MPLVDGINAACDGYSVIKKIGSGSYASVFKAKTSDGEVVAIKCVLLQKLSRQGKENMIREIRILRMLHHRHILKLINFSTDKKYVYLVTEYCEMGDLSKYIVTNRGIPRNLIHRFLQQLACGLKYLRAHSISHFDLKPYNLLITRTPQLCLKIADFGFAQMMTDEEYSHKVMGSPAYMAPEMIVSKEYSPKADLWSVGIILYKCLYGKLPFVNKCCELMTAGEEYFKLKIPEGRPISPACRNLLTRLLQYDPDERIDFDSFFSHDYIDLEHYPCEESYGKGVVLVHRAIELDVACKYQEAFDCYCEALRYLLPYLQEMNDVVQKRQLQQKIVEYTSRAEEIKSIFFVLHRENLTKPQDEYLKVLNEKIQAVHQDVEQTAEECSDPPVSCTNNDPADKCSVM